MPLQTEIGSTHFSTLCTRGIPILNFPITNSRLLYIYIKYIQERIQGGGGGGGFLGPRPPPTPQMRALPRRNHEWFIVYTHVRK